MPFDLPGFFGQSLSEQLVSYRLARDGFIVTLLETRQGAIEAAVANFRKRARGGNIRLRRCFKFEGDPREPAPGPTWWLSPYFEPILRSGENPG